MLMSALLRDSASGVFHFEQSNRNGFCGPRPEPLRSMPNTPWQLIGAISASSCDMRPPDAVSDSSPFIGSLRVNVARRLL